MYWIFLVIFTLIVFVPTAIQQGFSVFSLQQTQEFTILLLGSIGFLTFLVQEKRLHKNVAEKTDIQRKVNRMARDLTHSYSYIGEVNRKLDILEDITLGYPESLNLTAKRRKDIYNSTMEAIRIFGKSDEFALRFVNISDNCVVKEIKNPPELSINFSAKNFNPESQIFESEELIAIASPKAIDNVFSCIIIKKRNPAQRIEDLEMIKMLASQALFLFMFVRDKKQIAS
jgi:hypothetical protein